MAKKRVPSPASPASPVAAEVPVVGMREPCPCGSGRRYKACHGRELAHAGEALVRRPFQGLPAECDWIAMREIVPAATATLTLRPEHRIDADVTVATVLPMAWPALVRTDGAVYLGLQTRTGSGDPSRDAAAALLEALQTPAGNPVAYQRPEPGPRLQDVLDLDAPFEVQVRDGFDYWVDGVDLSEEVQQSLQKANDSVVPTRRLESVEAAYWCRIGSKEHLRWVLPHDEEPLLDAMSRLRAAGQDGLGPGTRLIGTFRAHGLLVPVWDLAPGASADQVEAPAQQWAQRLAEAMTVTVPLSADERRKREGLANRQVTIR
jgi:hypothetical protein